MSKLPFYYDEMWRDHQIEYYKFNDYELVKDLSVFENDFKIIILIFKKEDNNILAGFDDGIIFPYVNEKIFLFNSDYYKEFILNKVNGIINEIKKFYDKEIKIYMEPYTQFKLGFNLFNYLNFKNETILDLFNVINKNNITNGMKPSVKNTINKYLKKKIFTEFSVNIYYGNIDANIFEKFKNKHFELAQRKTKSDKCWDMLKQFIIAKKAVLVNYDNDFVYFFVSSSLSYYAINACTKKSDICTILIYEAFKFCGDNNFNYVYLYHYDVDSNDSKTKNLSYFKKSIANQLINNYYIKA